VSTALEAAAVAAVVIAAVLLVAWPFLTPYRGEPEQVLSERDRERLQLLERRDTAYADLRDLEQDHRTNKVSDIDYESERRRLRAEAAAALRALDQLESIPEVASRTPSSED
jgi:hypothetical protein